MASGLNEKAERLRLAVGPEAMAIDARRCRHLEVTPTWLSGPAYRKRHPAIGIVERMAQVGVMRFHLL